MAGKATTTARKARGAKIILYTRRMRFGLCNLFINSFLKKVLLVRWNYIMSYMQVQRGGKAMQIVSDSAVLLKCMFWLFGGGIVV